MTAYQRTGRTGQEQTILNILREGLSSTFTSPDFTTRLRQIKDLFVDRKYEEIFGNNDSLPIYAAEYTSSRALCYHNLFVGIPQVKELLSGTKGDVEMYCLGSGCGSELLGVAAAMAVLGSAQDGSPPCSNSEPSTVNLQLQDMADYSNVLERIQKSMVTRWEFCSTETKTNHEAADQTAEDTISVLRPRLTTNFTVSNALTDPKCISQFQKADLITCMFLLNELFAESKRSAVSLMIKLVENMKSGAMFLVVDSAGSFSDIDVGSMKKEKAYSVYHLLDGIASFDVLVKENSVWYRYPDNLQYPCKLNNMRHFIRLYRKK